TCRDLRPFCRVISRTKSIALRTIGEPGGPQEGLGKVTRYYFARESPLRIADTLKDGKEVSGKTRTGVRLANDIGDDFPDDVDRARYVEEARKTIQGVRSYHHLDPKHVPDHPLARAVLAAGLSPGPKRLVEQDGELRAKGVRRGTSP